VNKKHLEIGLAIGVSLFLVFIAYASRKPSAEEILEKVKGFPEVQPYKDLPVNVTFLSKERVEELSQKYPVIYGNISKDVYEIRFLSESKGLLVIYDAEENKIIRSFEIIGVKIK